MFAFTFQREKHCAAKAIVVGFFCDGKRPVQRFLRAVRATFLVAVEVSPEADLMGIAEDIQDSLTTDGIVVESVRPWDRAQLAAVGLLGQQQTQTQGQTNYEQTTGLFGPR